MRAITAALILLSGCALDRVGVGAAFDAASDLDAGPARDAQADAGHDGGTEPESDAGPLSPILDGDGRFARASEASFVDERGVVLWAAADVPRERIVEGVRLRLIEGARTNLMRDSDAQTTGWTPGAAATVTENVLLSPDLTLTGDRVSVRANEIGPSQPATVPAGDVTLSLWAARAGGTRLRARFSAEPVAFVVIDDEPTPPWTRYQVSGTTAVPATDVVALDGRSGVPRATDPPLAQDVFVWGWQLEVGSFASSYIRTASSSASRAPDEWLFDAASVRGAFRFAPSRLVFVPEWSGAQLIEEAWLFSVGADSGLRLRATVDATALDVVIGGSVVQSVPVPPFGRGAVMSVDQDPRRGILTVTVDGTESSITGPTWSWPPDLPVRLGAAQGGTGSAFGWISAPAAPGP